MDEWFEPLPFETVIATLFGAILSYTFASTQLSQIKSWKDAINPTEFYTAIAIFVVLMCLCSKAVSMKRLQDAMTFAFGMLLCLAAMNLYWARDLISPGEGVYYVPDKYVVFSSSLLIAWFLLTLLSAIVSRMVRS